MKHLNVYIFLFFAILLISCNNSQTERLEIKNGFLDLSSWNFEKNGAINLNGDWEFYWNKLLTPNDFKTSNFLKPEYIKLPDNNWTKINSKEKPYPEFGYATYRLKIKIPDKHKDYRFRFSKIYSSTKVWVNDSLRFEKGKVDTTKKQSKPKFFVSHISANQIHFTENDTLEIIIQVADFYKGGHYAGLIRKIKFGYSNQIYEDQNKTDSLNSILIGIMLLIAVYHFFLFAYRSKEYSNLIFGLLSLVVVIRTSFTAGLFLDLFSYAGCFKYGFFPVILYPPLLLSFFYLLYKNEVHKKFLSAILIITLIFIPVVLFTSVNFMNKLEPLSAIFGLSIILYLLIYSLPKAIIRKKQGAGFSYLGVFILFASNVHDYLFAFGLIVGFGIYITQIGFGLYIILQSLNLAQIFSISLKKNIKLNKELDYQNKNLEKIVTERTKTIEMQKTVLVERNTNLRTQKEEIQTQNEILNQQKEEIEVQRDYAHFQNKKISIAHKNITDSISYASRIQNAILPTDKIFNENFSDYFILFKPKDVVSGDFYWAKKLNEYLVFAVADCTGHGVPGAFVSMLGISFLNEIVRKKEIQTPAHVLEELRIQIKTSLHQTGDSKETKDGMDIALCIINTKTNLLQFAGAYNPIYIIRNKKIIEIKGTKNPIGIFMKERPFINNEIQLQKGDLCYLFSDGYSDQFGGEHADKYKIINFKKLLISVSGKQMTEQKQILNKELKDWQANLDQIDDILVVGVKI